MGLVLLGIGFKVGSCGGWVGMWVSDITCEWFTLVLGCVEFGTGLVDGFWCVLGCVVGLGLVNGNMVGALVGLGTNVGWLVGVWVRFGFWVSLFLTKHGRFLLGSNGSWGGWSCGGRGFLVSLGVTW